MSNKITLEIIVNGTPTQVEGNVNAPLKSLIGRALEQTGNTGQPEDNWEFRNAPGNVLDGDKKIGEFGFTEGARIFLNLKAGVGG